MTFKRSTIKQGLEQLEFQSIQQILIGELKEIDLVINEFDQLFEIHEIELEIESHESAEHDERGSEKNKTN